MSTKIRGAKPMRGNAKFNWILLLAIIGCLIAPLVICFCCECISGDGLLGYFGSLIGSAVAIVVAVMAYNQSKRSSEAEKDLAAQQRREEIAPSFQITVKPLKNNEYEVKIINHSNYNAIGVYLYEYSLHHYVAGGSEQVKVITTNKENTQYMYVDPAYMELNNSGLPKEINLTYGDIDNNLISDVFVCRGNEYELDENEYI